MADEVLYPKVDYDADLPPDTMATLDMNGVDPQLFRRLDGWKEPAPEAEASYFQAIFNGFNPFFFFLSSYLSFFSSVWRQRAGWNGRSTSPGTQGAGARPGGGVE